MGGKYGATRPPALTNRAIGGRPASDLGEQRRTGRLRTSDTAGVLVDDTELPEQYWTGDHGTLGPDAPTSSYRAGSTNPPGELDAPSTSRERAVEQVSNWRLLKSGAFAACSQRIPAERFGSLVSARSGSGSQAVRMNAPAKACCQPEQCEKELRSRRSRDPQIADTAAGEVVRLRRGGEAVDPCVEARRGTFVWSR